MSSRKGKQRKPKFRESADDGKHPHLAPHLASQSDPNQDRPTWSFLLCDISGPFGWDTTQDGDLLRVIVFLKNLEQSKISEIFGQRNRGNHQPRPDQLGPTAQGRLKELRLEPERLASLRLNKANRIWAIRDRSILSLLWWDPNHLVWPDKNQNQ